MNEYKTIFFLQVNWVKLGRMDNLFSPDEKVIHNKIHSLHLP
jgi:hypothetical protein